MADEETKQYRRRYYQRNKEKEKKRGRKYYEKNREKIIARTVKWQKEHKEERRKYMEKWRDQNRHKIREYDREYLNNGGEEKRVNKYRKTIIGTSGTWIRNLNKRDWTGYCELCGKIYEKDIKRINYHHWDSDNPSKGIWVCWECHQVCELVEKERLYLINKYLKLKVEVEKEYENLVVGKLNG